MYTYIFVFMLYLVWWYFSVLERLASFPGLHAQLLSLAVRKAGEGLDGLIT